MRTGLRLRRSALRADSAALLILRSCRGNSLLSLRSFRSDSGDRWIGGVAGGLAEVSGIPAWSWRILFVLTALLDGIGLVMYILLWIFVPLQIRLPQVLMPPPKP